MNQNKVNELNGSLDTQIGSSNIMSVAKQKLSSMISKAKIGD